MKVRSKQPLCDMLCMHMFWRSCFRYKMDLALSRKLKFSIQLPYVRFVWRNFVDQRNPTQHQPLQPKVIHTSYHGLQAAAALNKITWSRQRSIHSMGRIEQHYHMCVKSVPCHVMFTYVHFHPKECCELLHCFHAVPSGLIT